MLILAAASMLISKLHPWNKIRQIFTHQVKDFKIVLNSESADPGKFSFSLIRWSGNFFQTS